jgi:exopolysaccharide biosynthesis polyprenyl glycosylphosphotransferase
MQNNLRLDANSTAGFDATSAGAFTLITPRKPGFMLRPVVARALASTLSATVDLVVLSVTLISLALWASGGPVAGNVMALLSARISVGHFAMIAVCWMVWRTIFSYCGLYTWQHIQSAIGVPGRVAVATGISAMVAGEVVAWMWHHGHALRIAVAFWIVATAGTLTSRVVICLFQLYVRPHLRRCRYAVIVGGGARAAQFLNELKLHPEWEYRFIGYVDSVAQEIPGHQWPLLGRIGDLEDILMRQVVDEVVVALPVRTQYAAIERTISICRRVGVQVQYCEDLFESQRTGQCYREHYDNQKVILKMVPNDYRHRIKRSLDVIGAGFGLILLSPLFLVVAILIKSTSKGPVFFKQARYGLGKRTFCIYKFRTMVENAEAAQASLEHMNENSGPVFKIFKDPRITKLGAVLRKTSIDELPQLFNVLKGEMSLVGPRPLNLRDVGRFSEAWLMRRFSVKPGITCLWQISGRSTVSFDRWIELDLHYIDHWSLELDLKILARTIPAVLRGTGAA